MRLRGQKHTIIYIAAFLLCSTVLFSQESLNQSLKEENEYYNNYGVSGYSKKEIERQVIPYYDNFGSHIVNGYLIYGLQTDRSRVFDSDDQNSSDSTINASNNLFQTSLVSEAFNNFIITRDALGDMKSVFLVGSQIYTKFTPLTMNKLNFQGVRWDIWTPAIKFTTLISRTRPFIMSQNDVSGNSYIGYYRDDMRNWQGVVRDELLPDEEYIEKNWGLWPPDVSSDDTYGKKRGWQLNYDENSDYSNKSIYGDYDILWGFHGKTNVKGVNLGLTYLNHHRSDVKKGEKVFSGDLPNDYIPSEIHFEFYDLTPETESDPGVRVEKVTMTMNGQDLGPDGEGAAYLLRSDDLLVNSALPVGCSGNRPVIVAFNTSFAAKNHFGDSTKVQRIDFTFTVAGNYIVFVSTDKMVTMGYAGKRNSQTNEVELDGPFTRSISGTYESQQLPGWTKYIIRSNTSQEMDPFTYARHGKDFTTSGNSWFGDYIAKSPSPVYASGSGIEAAYASSRRSYSYTYSINAGSETYGIDFKGKMFGVNFNGEVAVNRKDYIYPGGERFDPVNRLAAYIKLDRGIIPEVLTAKGMLYNVDPEYDPALEIPQVSGHFSYSYLYNRFDRNESYFIPDYLRYPQHFNNNFHLLDDNDDNDLYVESDRMVYPGDLGSGSAVNRWQADGTFNSYKASGQRMYEKANFVSLPTGLQMFYGDDNGVYTDQFDRNHNGLVDYKEDFLLYDKEPPNISELDNDKNNNGVWDLEEDDPYPDLPKGIQPSYVLVSNGWKSQGIRGATAGVDYTPIKNLKVSGVGVFEKAIDLDFSPLNDATAGYDGEGNQSLTLKSLAMLNVVKRSLGLQYYLGGEIQYLRDNIRNDVIRLQEVEDIEFLYQDYYYQTDELRYRNAIVGNAIAGFTYNNIPNFSYKAALNIGANKTLPLNGRFYTVRTIRNQALDTTLYEYRWETYDASLTKRVSLVNKFDYQLNFNFNFKDKFAPLNFLNRFSLNPQYKFAWSYSGNSETVDPRDAFDPDELLTDQLLTEYRVDWARYRTDNISEFMSAPILRCAFKIAEKTIFQYGVQWKKTFDWLVKEQSSLRRVQTLQVYSSDNVAGYNVALLMGMNFINNDYDILKYDEVFQSGHLYDGRDLQFFIRVYAGN
ncbi:MAG: hypothetical protein A2268_00015 [Candidatus Raymondbacteria bacterium RifOxyA12_full_50_37]|uniref:Uncharacterized protein n=1 Tax=Candidatus Raymondbacteria bacterium RIFOXYD12_FULL_49_13 TaxID=1817890 RepID=A0A1F7F3A9_UNCRA|nr:MAG: hypothetical protein A2248_00385 [Candidatus Raymondbacteria bacterium RIFOXYA2_FULL_49_16]OGJ91091.1 MAG: hypothetical protein A2350_07285 [Candidatus Raymondbacteria bacterium RifOxyB12_full_50_8]OGJ91360.1 MAG: hypothetical protein A2268_00015 [Candidatus Raymondbacteria bacterium RifOxyA12_full_50_37]OGJ97145.1 MAG: hypothetical protein A2453_12535 [Candidatus Raymondbacteria bacterium RIFOXYC2_FULL_50_21]OGK01154.1 MAG: hypothetical protein A2519_01360 [Candidatus Raymondbacteria b